MPITNADKIAEYMVKYTITDLTSTTNEDGEIVHEVAYKTPTSIWVYTAESPTVETSDKQYLTDNNILVWGNSNEICFIEDPQLKDENNVWTEVTE